MTSKETKIGIVTVHRTENCGSFLQAYVLQAFLQDNGFDVSFIDYTNKNQTKVHYLNFLKKIAKCNINGAKLELRKHTNFNKCRRAFPLISMEDCLSGAVAHVIIGSDTLWNIDESHFRNNVARYFGSAFKSNNIHTITYAVSVGNTDCSLLSQDEIVSDSIKKLDAVSVRDVETQKLVSAVTGQTPVVVCDPTILWSKEQYDNLIKNREEKNRDSILIYYFGKIPEVTIKKIIELRDKTGKKIVSFGEYRPWCDKSISYDPYDFLQCYRDASFVITNTFHGTVFSLIYNKQFVDYGKSKKKIKDLLEYFDLSSCLIDDDIELLDYFNSNINYSSVNNIMSRFRDKSSQYLLDNLN